jgi:hypothetical protein
MDAKEYLRQLNIHLSHLYAFARQVNELDFAASLSGEFRGAQDAGWSTTITANEVFDELTPQPERSQPLSKAELRVILMLYCQLSEAGGVYESIKNIMGVITLKPYLLWPFKDLVRVKDAPRRIIGPNANATFRDLGIAAKEIGLSCLSSLLEIAFRDDIRNGISHADYVIWDDGLRLRKRNGGHAAKLSFEELNDALTQAIGFFQMLREYNSLSMRSFDPPKEIVGRLSMNFPMPWTVACDPNAGTFGISGSSPGPVTNAAYQRQVEINSRLGGKVLAIYTQEPTPVTQGIEAHILKAGFEPNHVVMTSDELAALAKDIERLGLWDDRKTRDSESDVLIVSPWGFRWLLKASDFDEILGKPLIDFDVS